MKNRNVVAVCGLPGVGKTTIFREYMEGKKWEPFVYKQLLSGYYNEKNDLYLLGIYTDELFSGTDKLSMAVQPVVEEWLTTHTSNVLFEGDRLTNKSFLSYVSNLEKTNFQIVAIEVPKDIRRQRFKDRGSNQSRTILNARETKYKRIVYDQFLLPYIKVFKNVTVEDKNKILDFLENDITNLKTIKVENDKIGIRKFL